MDWNSFYQQNHEIIIGGMFTLIGVVIGCVLNLIQSYFQNKREDKIHLREKREESYYSILNFYNTITISPNRKNKPIENIDERLNEFKSLLMLYGSKKMIDLVCSFDVNFSKSVNGLHKSEELNEVFDKLMKQIRSELGIKD